AGVRGARQHAEDQMRTIDMQHLKTDRSIHLARVDIEDRSEELAAIHMRSGIGKTESLGDQRVRDNVAHNACNAPAENAVPGDENIATFNFQHDMRLLRLGQMPSLSGLNMRNAGGVGSGP